MPLFVSFVDKQVVKDYAIMKIVIRSIKRIFEDLNQ